MCHNSGIQSAQIEKFMEHGMPQKIVKTVEYTLRKRAKEHKRRTESPDQLCLPELDSDCDESIPEDGYSMPISSSCTCSTNASSTKITPTAATVTALASASATTKTTKETIKQTLPVPTEIRKHPDNINKLKIPKLCGRFRHLQNQTEKESITNLHGDIAFDNNGSVSSRNSNGNGNGTSTKLAAEVYVDVLAVSTQLTKQFAERLNCAVMKLQSSKIYTLLTKTTQPAHIIAVCILSFVLMTVGPDIIESRTMAVTSARDVVASIKTDARKHKTLAVIAYLGAFATHFGAQIWMTFVSGLSLYFSLPRHTFGQCQQILFPKYFALNSMLSIGMLILFVKYFLSRWNLSACVQLTALAMTAFIEVAVRLYLAPPMLRLMHEKYKIEDAIGSGQEIGSLAPGDLVQCPHYQRIHKAFRRIHMTVAMGNMAVLLATCLHLYYLASKIQIT